MQHKRLTSTRPTAGVDFVMFVHDDIRFQCWDASGDPRYKHVAKVFAKDCLVILHVFDVTSQESLDEAMQWRENIVSGQHCQHFLIGNKADKTERAGGISAALEQYPDMLYYEISAKKLPDIEQMFDSILLICQHLTQDQTTSSGQTQECCIMC